MNEATKTSRLPFAPGVYRDETPDPRIGTAIASLRSELRGEARALRSALSRPRVPPELVAEEFLDRAALDELLATPKKGDALAAAIRARGVEGPAAAALARSAKKKVPHESLASVVAGLVKTTTLPEGRTLIGLVGPAGVGKTTTAAKLAARAKMAKKSVALISCDAYRVGAMDQLGAYADLMGARFHTACSPAELLEILAKEDADVVIVDTSGKPIESETMEAALGSAEIRKNKTRRVSILLCVSASLRHADAARVHRDYAMADPTALVVTKVDETETPAGLLHAAFATRLPISTLCTGQRVPEDIKNATSDAIGRALFPESST